ncbi:MAG: DUF4384 domain-containing protein, partial [Deltaproteobacteria bacterium]|nr:DUF4384 domain-containing protein [Deltaproteobacteria bacterium]
IKTYARGFITQEKVEWQPSGHYQKDSSMPPILEYRVKITADVQIPIKKNKSLGLKAKLSNSVFKNGERARITINVTQPSRIAIFNIRADDKVAMIFPNLYENKNIIMPGHVFLFPDKDSKVDLEMQTLPGHRRDAEAFFVIALAKEHNREFHEIFPYNDIIDFSAFFKTFSDIADYAEDLILTYEVIKEKEPE